MASEHVEPVSIPPEHIEPVIVPPEHIEPVIVPPEHIEPVYVPPEQIEPVDVPPEHVEPVDVAPEHVEPVSKPQSVQVAAVSKPKKPRKQPVKLFAIDVTGLMHKRSDYPTEENWQALLDKLGKVTLIEATSQLEAWKKYGEQKGQK